MQHFSEWMTGLLGLALTGLGTMLHADKKQNAATTRALEDKQVALTERLTRIEVGTVSEKEVRAILKDCFDPVANRLYNIQSDVQAIKVQLAKIPNSRGDDA